MSIRPVSGSPQKTTAQGSASASTLSDLAEKCAVCDKSGVDLSQCGKCQQVSYCSHECQKKAWKVHKTMCKEPAPLALEGPTTSNAPKGLPPGSEYAVPVFDGRKWKLAYSRPLPPSNKNFPTSNEYRQQYRYVPASQELSSWQELVTLNFTPSEGEKSFDMAEVNSPKKVLDPRLGPEWKTITKTQSEWILESHAEYTEDRCKYFEMMRMVHTPQGFHTFCYATKNIPVSEKIRTLWVNNLRAVEIKGAAPQAKKCGTCENRETEAVPFSLCGRCKKISYCSLECQKAHWKVHKLVCTPPAPLAIEGPATVQPTVFTPPTNLLPGSEYALPVFDNRKWMLGWSHPLVTDMYFTKSGRYRTQDEYVLKGESAENWSELLTISCLPLIGNQPFERCEKNHRDELKKEYPNSTFQWNTLHQTNNEWMWEWSATQDRCPIVQSEITRVVYTSSNIHTFHYGIKKNPMPPKLRRAWIQNLKAIEIKKI